MSSPAEPSYPKVIVWIVTYKHEAYIEKAVRSVLAQQTDFPFDIFIAEDNSPDGTRDICKRLASEHPDRITLFLNDPNKGATQNGFFLYHQCIDHGADYIATLEGDDFWMTTDKLQKQVNVLNAQPDVSLVFTDAVKVKDGLNVPFYHQDKPPRTLDMAGYVRGKFRIPTCTVLMRSSIMKEVLAAVPKLEGLFHVDFFMWCVAGKQGRLYFIDEVTASYTVHSASMTRATTELDTLTKGMNMNAFLADYFGSPISKHFLQNNWWYYLEYAFMEIRNKKYFNSLGWLLRSLSNSLKFNHRNQAQIIRDYVYRLRHRSV